MSNVNLLDALLKPHFQVESKTLSTDAEKVHYPCRDLPHSTLMWLLAEIANKGNAYVQQSRKAMVERITQMVAEKKLEMDEHQVRSALDTAIPIIQGLLIESPTWVERLLKDCIAEPNLTDVHISAISAEDAACILSAVADRLDTALLAEKIGSVFTKATGAISQAPKKASPNGQSEAPQNIAELPQPLSQEASPTSSEPAQQ